MVTSYAARRPDGSWSLMLVNRDHDLPHEVRVVFEDGAGHTSKSFAGSVAMVTFGSDQYVWIDDGPRSHADPDHAPVATTVPGGGAATFALPKASITVLRGRVE
jgi:hypothetical protein